MGDLINSIWDKYTIKLIKGLHPEIKDRTISFILRMQEEKDINLRIFFGYRTWKKQQQLYNLGRNKLGEIIKKKNIRTYAKPGLSYHNYGLAIDVVEIIYDKKLKKYIAKWNNDLWSVIGEIGKSYGFQWGGDWKGFKDSVHFQYTGGHSVFALKRRYEAGRFRLDGFIDLSKDK